MRTRAGIVLIEDGKVALIERFRAGRHYFSFPGGGVDEGETPEQAAIREAMEELGVEVVVKQKVAEILFNGRTQHYFLVEQVGGIFGSGTGEEYTDSHPDDPETGVYIPMWMPIEELETRDNVFPPDVAKLTYQSLSKGWSLEPIFFEEQPPK
jgi:8-oxo-dGTP pyrophosphatase MutT (NUDIX family)